MPKVTRPDPTHWNADPDIPCLLCQPVQLNLCVLRIVVGTEAPHTCREPKVDTGQPDSTLYPDWGATERGEDWVTTRHLHRLVRVLQHEHGRPRHGWEARWEVMRGSTSHEMGEAVPGSRLGHSSRRTGKPFTQAQRSQRSLLAKAPRFSEIPAAKVAKEQEKTCGCWRNATET